MNRTFVSKILISALLSTVAASALNINITTKYGKTGGIVGPLNKIGDKVNGVNICPADPTAGCDFKNDPGYSNNNTVEDPTDDTYSGDLLIRTNDAFEAKAGWTWAGTKDDEQKVTISSTLPKLNGKSYY